MAVTDGNPPPAGNADDAELPGYSTRAQPTQPSSERTYQLEDSKGRAWVWLTVQSRAPSGQQLLLYSGDTVSGRVDVDFDKTDVKGVSTTVRLSPVRPPTFESYAQALRVR